MSLVRSVRIPIHGASHSDRRRVWIFRYLVSSEWRNFGQGKNLSADLSIEVAADRLDRHALSIDACRSGAVLQLSGVVSVPKTC